MLGLAMPSPTDSRSSLPTLPAYLAATLLALCGGGCPSSGPKPADSKRTDAKAAEKPAATPALPDLAPTTEVVLSSGAYDTLGAARVALEEILKAPVDLPLPFPRVERHRDRFRTVLARGRFGELRALAQALQDKLDKLQVEPVSTGGGDDIIKLGILCTAGESVPVYAEPPEGQKGKLVLREIGQLAHGRVVVLKEGEGEEDHHGGGEPGEPEAAAGSDERPTERGYVTILQPQVGLVYGPQLLVPSDCTPRDEDNDDGNGRLLGHGPEQPGGRLCLTTRFAGRRGPLAMADLLAVAPSYRRCTRFPGAGTFDGFDHSPNGSHFAVEVESGLRVYAVLPRGELLLRGELPRLARPAYLGDNLVAVDEQGTAGEPPGLYSLPKLARREAQDASPIGSGQSAPVRIFSLGPASTPRPKAVVYRPAAPTLSDNKIRTSFQQGCRPDVEKRVQQALPAFVKAKRLPAQCVLEVEVTVGPDGGAATRRCRADSAPNALEEPLQVPCP